MGVLSGNGRADGSIPRLRVVHPLARAVAAALALAHAVGFAGELGVFLLDALGPDLDGDFVERVEFALIAVFGQSVE